MSGAEAAPSARRGWKDRSRSWYQHGRFFWGWLRDPLSVGAILPSGRSVARLMVQGLRPGVRVIELGAGTGTVTRAILDAGVRPEDLLIIEKNAEFSRFLSRRFPGVAVANADALELGRHLGHLSGPADFVISGLPLVLFSAAERMRLLSQALAALAPDGVFHQFSYIGRFPIGRAQLGAVGAESSLMGFAAFNIPPAFVYRLCRSAAPQASRESRLDALTGGLRLDTPAG